MRLSYSSSIKSLVSGDESDRLFAYQDILERGYAKPEVTITQSLLNGESNEESLVALLKLGFLEFTHTFPLEPRELAELFKRGGEFDKWLKEDSSYNRLPSEYGLKDFIDCYKSGIWMGYVWMRRGLSDKIYTWGQLPCAEDDATFSEYALSRTELRERLLTQLPFIKDILDVSETGEITTDIEKRAIDTATALFSLDSLMRRDVLVSRGEWAERAAETDFRTYRPARKEMRKL